ncbi:MAG TPA: thioredoxin family protein [Candidatus Limnocylindrales bacterium]|nr:thioredoxin family protein [Candidatus Limnocylindrales bacterium]
MAERVAILIIVATVLIGLYLLLKRRQLSRVARRGLSDPLLQTARTGVPTVVYFTTPNCAPCRYQQKPALAKLAAELGDAVQIIEVDAAAQPEDAKRWGVFTAPTTFVLNSDGAPHTVNHGVADAAKLAGQIRAAQAARTAPLADSRVA